ncbi:MAG: hypothetical protein M3Y64_08495, partial [Gemmatimonadota bacterium]|nr:hypothetical protein [Gemmatimonadota bacterium]
PPQPANPSQASQPDPAHPTTPGEPSDPGTPPPPPRIEVSDAGGPRVLSDGTKINTSRRATSISLAMTAPIDEHSATVHQFSITTYSAKAGWSTVDVGKVTVDNSAKVIALELKTAIPAHHMVRIIARGTGPQPLLGTDLVPLAGRTGGPPGTADDGNDFHIMLRSS